MFGRPKLTVTTPSPDAAQPAPDAVATPALDQLRADAPATREVQLQRDLALVADELVWLKERFGKLQNRVTAELREIRREVDRLYEVPDGDDEDEG